jgi:hypothetical protein
MVQIGDDGQTILYADGREVSAADIADKQVTLLLERFGFVPWLPPEMQPPPRAAPSPPACAPAAPPVSAEQLSLV